MAWPFLSYFMYYFHLSIHIVATSVIWELLLFTLHSFSTHLKRFLNICNKTCIEIVILSFIIMQNTVYLVYYDASPDHAPSQYGKKQNKRKRPKCVVKYCVYFFPICIKNESFCIGCLKSNFLSILHTGITEKFSSKENKSLYFVEQPAAA